MQATTIKSGYWATVYASSFLIEVDSFWITEISSEFSFILNGSMLTGQLAV